MKTILPTLLIIFFLCAGINSYPQCKMFAKKYCMDKLKPYIFNGQINTLKISEGEMAELNLTFQKGQNYRIYVCSQGNFDRVEFKVINATNNDLLFYNKNQDFTEVWDFKSNTAEQIAIRVFVPEPEKKENMVQSGCVSIMIGFMDK